MSLIVGLLVRIAELVATNDKAMAIFLVAGACGLVFRHENGVDLPRSPGGVAIGLVCIGCSLPLRGAWWLARHAHAFETLSVMHRWRRAADANNEEPGRIIHREPIRVQGEKVGTRLYVRLPEGRIASDYNVERIASAYRVPIANVTPDPLDQGVIHVAILKRYPLSRIINADPITQTLEPAGVVSVGLTNDGDPLILDTRLSHIAAGGQTRYGKSNLLHLLVAHYCSRASTTLVVGDGKRPELVDWRDRAAEYVGPEPKKLLRVLRLCEAEMRRRYDRLEELGKRNVADCDPEDRPGALLIVVDEVSRYLDDRTRVAQNLTCGKAIEETILRLVREGLAADVHVAVATQKATDDALPTAIRDICETRVAFSCSTREMGEAILGRGHGRLAAELPAGDAHRGRCVVGAMDGTPTLGRCSFASDAWIRRAASLTPRRTLSSDLPRIAKLYGLDLDFGADKTAQAAPAAASGRSRPGPKPGSPSAQRAAERLREAHAARAALLDAEHAEPSPDDEDAA